MIRLVVYLIAILALATGLAWLADRPGSLVLNWQGYEIETSVFRAIVILALLLTAGLFLWSMLRTVWMSPALLGRYMRKQRQKKGLDALSGGMIAISAGDRTSALKLSEQARRSLPNEPLTHLLRAQAADMSGDRATAKRIYESMLSSPDTELLGLRGLYLEATEMDEPEAARHFASRALKANPALSWPVDATFKHQCQDSNWVGALETLATARRFGHVDKKTADRRRAVLLTARAQILEDSRPDDALTLALEAHGLAKDLVPAAAIAGRILASKGNTAKAAKVLQKTWTEAPHPDLATAYAYARIGDSPKDRLIRVRKLAQQTPKSIEGPIAVAVAAIDAKNFDDARHVLQPFLDDRVTQRIATLMARIEREQHGDTGRIREWLARGLTAARDPAWTADGVVSDQWAPVSPVSGELDAYTWRVPVERAPGQNPQLLAAKAEELIAMLVADQKPAIEATPEPVVEPTKTGPSAPKPDNRAKDVSRSQATEKTSDTTAPASTPAAKTTSATPVSAASNSSSRDGNSGDADADRVTFTPYKAKTGQKNKKKFQHIQASVAIKSDRSQQNAPSSSRPHTKSDHAAQTQSTKQSRSDDRTFVAPRAPDDPGPDLDDQDIASGLYKPYRAS